ncbi:MAG: hypothetical protein DRJ51_04275 [Thermoprotei archaeon]|nr:MAG: hypothetical protein DRJ51_04275 [Thermoprotei archaeon]RLF02915.1 MAG: hypothetical protein DRJ59_02235 [Thermoprotei archaeon]
MSRVSKSRFAITVVFLVVLAVVIWHTFLKGLETELKREKPAPDFEFIDIQGKKYKLSSFKGQVVLIDFMATWCGPCKQQILTLKRIHPKYEGKVVFLSISVDPRESLEALANYGKASGITWILGKSYEAAIKYGISAIPTIVIIDKDGYIVFRASGVTPEDQLRKVLDEAISQG